LIAPRNVVQGPLAGLFAYCAHPALAGLAPIRRQPREWRRAVVAKSNEEFIADPADHIIAIIDDVARAELAERALMDAGFEEVRIYRGRTGAHAIDASGTEHGLGGFLVRFIEQSLTNKDNLAEYESAVERGQSVISLRVDGDEARRDEAVGLLEREAAHTINYFGKAVVHTLRP
jgi:hypothetical protein